MARNPMPTSNGFAVTSCTPEGDRTAAGDGCQAS